MTTPRGAWLGFFHRSSTDALLKSLAEALRPPDYTVEELLHDAETRFHGNLMFSTDVRQGQRVRGRISVTVCPFRPPPRVHMPNRSYEVQRPATSDEVGCISIGAEFRIDEDFAVEQMLLQIAKAWPVLRPTFAYGDEEVRVLKTAGPHPERLAWPWMIYGPEMIAKWGEEHLRKAPAWRVEKLDYGGMLLQVAENPFTATRRQVKALADHLGLEAPR